MIDTQPQCHPDCKCRYGWDHIPAIPTSDTPRTDAEALKSRPPFAFVTRKFAEDLERELNKAYEALRCIAEWGGRTLESEYGDIDCNGKWCAEQAKEAAK